MSATTHVRRTNAAQHRVVKEAREAGIDPRPMLPVRWTADDPALYEVTLGGCRRALLVIEADGAYKIELSREESPDDPA